MRKAAMAVAAAFILAAPVAALAQDAQGRPAKVTVYYSRSETVLKAEAMTFSRRFSNKGDYVAVLLESPLLYKRFGVAATFLKGSSDDIPGADDFITSGYNFAYYGTFNPLTDETIKRLCANLTFTALDFKNAGNLDLTAGYFLLEAQPGISKGNTFGGWSAGLKGGYDWSFGDHGVGLTGMFSYVPAYFVHGNVEGQFTDDYIMEYRAGLEYTFLKRYGLTAGYQGMYLKGRITDETLGYAQYAMGRPVSDEAIVTANGFYFGALVKF